MCMYSVPFRTLSWLLICSLLTSCTVHRMGSQQEPRKDVIVPSRNCIMQYGEERHQRTGYISDVRNDILVITRLVKMEWKGEEMDVLPEDIEGEHGTLLLEMDSAFQFAVSDTMYIPLDAVQAVRIVQVDIAGTVIMTLLGIAGLLALLIAVILLTKESCPFVYAFDGIGWTLEGEIFSGAVHPPLERDDYLRLPALAADADLWHVRLTNEVREIQQTNLAELLVCAHEEGTSVLIDKYGTAHVLRNPQPPVAAVSLQGDNVLERVRSEDNVILESSLEKNGNVLDGLVLTFRKPPDVRDARLVLKAKNSFWLDHAFGAFYDAFGNVYHDWNDQQKSESADKLRQWSLDQNIPLSVYVKESGEWVWHDYFNIAGPIALRSDVLPLRIPDDGSSEVQIKLVSGRFFWVLDHVALDSGPGETIEPQVVQLAEATTNEGEDATADLRKKDDRYQVMGRYGQYVECAFQARPPAPGMRQTVFLHSSGHYEAIRDPSGVPDLPFLYSFQRAERFNQFATELFFDQMRKGQSAKRTESAQ